MIKELNERARRLGYEVVAEETFPINGAGGPFMVNMGGGPWCRVMRDGEPVFRFSWRGEEVATWLTFREREVAA